MRPVAIHRPRHSSSVDQFRPAVFEVVDPERHPIITDRLRNGATLPEAKELAKHSDVNMAMRYTHIEINDWSKAVRNLAERLSAHCQ